MADVGPPAPGSYPVVVVGSGPGGLQLSYFLRRLGLDHAVISADDGPGGMFRRFPLYQRLISWTKPFTEEERGTRAYARHDWNSLLADEPENNALVVPFMDGSLYFPSRAEMESGLAEFARKAAVTVRYGCRWEATTRDDDGFVVHTSDGDFRCKVCVFAVGATKAWKPRIPGIDEVPHYVDCREPKSYAGKRVVIIGKRNSAFEIGDALLPWARRLILVSPRPAQTALSSFSVGAIRARYLQPYEDHLLGGGNVVLNGAIERIARTAGAYEIGVRRTETNEPLVLSGDEVIAATGFECPLLDLPRLGVATFNQGRMPAQTPFWESPTVPGVYFAGSVSQGAAGLRKYGIPSSSGAVHGFRHNARVLAEHVAQKHFGIQPPRRRLARDDVVRFMCAEAAGAPELWNQKSYLARVVTFDGGGGATDAGILPLAHFVASSEPDAAAIAVETDTTGETHPALYLRTGGEISEHLLPSHPLLDFRSDDHAAELRAILQPVLG